MADSAIYDRNKATKYIALARSNPGVVGRTIQYLADQLEAAGKAVEVLESLFQRTHGTHHSWVARGDQAERQAEVLTEQVVSLRKQCDSLRQQLVSLRKQNDELVAELAAAQQNLEK